jgi:hypothetical protein
LWGVGVLSHVRDMLAAVNGRDVGVIPLFLNSNHLLTTLT